MPHQIDEVIEKLQALAPMVFAEGYDNPGLLTGDPAAYCTGITCCLDATLAVLQEAKSAGCNLVVAHHPILFHQIKSLAGDHYTLQAIRFAIKNDIAIYASHTNLDNVIAGGVNAIIADKIGLQKTGRSVLDPKPGLIAKLYTYVPPSHLAAVQNALFAAGAGTIGRYDECSFTSHGTGSFRPGEGTNPFIGTTGGPRETVEETKLEVVFELHKQATILNALKSAHPYEEVAYEIIGLANQHQEVGSGLFGHLPEPLAEPDFMQLLAATFRCKAIRHTAFTGQNISRVAICGGAGSFLTRHAMAAGADAFVTADLKYHEYFEVQERMLLADIGHYESEQFTIDLLQQHLKRYFTTFAVLSTKVNTNPTSIFVA